MTFYELALKHLTDGGLSKNDAKTVVELYIADDKQEPMKGRWNESITGYPEMMQNLLKNTLNHFTTNWIKEHQPGAWYLPVFSGVMPDGTPVEEAMAKEGDKKND